MIEEVVKSIVTLEEAEVVPEIAVERVIPRNPTQEGDPGQDPNLVKEGEIMIVTVHPITGHRNIIITIETTETEIETSTREETETIEATMADGTESGCQKTIVKS